MPGPNWKLEDDYKTVTVTFPTDPPATLKFDAAGIDDLLRGLGSLRLHMKPEIQAALVDGEKAEALTDPAWRTENEPLTGLPLLHIRDMRFGWVHYLLPQQEAAKMGTSLRDLAAIPLPKPPQGKSN
jgi:hypothetical protein